MSCRHPAYAAGLPPAGGVIVMAAAPVRPDRDRSRPLMNTGRSEHSVGFFAAALVVGALLSGGRAMVLNRWFLALPTAVSGHNTEWWWGPGDPRATTMVAVGGADYDGYLAQFFSSVQPVATLSNPAGIHNQEWGGRAYLCTGPISPWAQLWPQLRHYD